MGLFDITYQVDASKIKIEDCIITRPIYDHNPVLVAHAVGSYQHIDLNGLAFQRYSEEVDGFSVSMTLYKVPTYEDSVSKLEAEFRYITENNDEATFIFNSLKNLYDVEKRQEKSLDNMPIRINLFDRFIRSKITSDFIQFPDNLLELLALHGNSINELKFKQADYHNTLIPAIQQLKIQPYCVSTL